MKKSLFNKNFILVVIGQIVSLFGNTMLRFALPLYILQETGSATIFGSILALSMIPTIILSPFGGMLADRVSKKWIMVILDFITATLVLVFSLIINSVDNIIVYICFVLVFLSIIQSFYQPAVQSSIPVIVDREKILDANAVVSLINSLANLLGPVLGGIFFGVFGLIPLLYASALCFFLAAIMELFIYIKHIPLETSGGILATVKDDIKLSLTFISKDKPVVLKTLLIAAGINLVLSAMILVGYPIFITVKLELSSQMYGYSEGILAAGAISGGLLVSLVSKKLKITDFYLILVLASLCLVPMSFPFLFNLPPINSYVILCVSGFAIMSLSTIFSIRMMAFMQELTPAHLLGKVISYVLTICMFALPLGQLLYGFLYTHFTNELYFVILAGALLSLLISFSAKKTFKTFDQ